MIHFTRMWRTATAIAGAWAVACASQAALSNGDFSQGLESWTAEGDVTVNAAAEAVLRDGVFRALLYAAAPVPGEPIVVTFDIQADMSSETPAGTFPDAFFASLYFVDDLDSFDLDAGVFDGAIGLLDLDAQGFFNVAGTFSASPKGDDWMRFSAEASVQTHYAVLAFELFDLNQISGDSRVLIDNVHVIPEPRSFLLLAIALAWLRTLHSRQPPRDA